MPGRRDRASFAGGNPQTLSPPLRATRWSVLKRPLIAALVLLVVAPGASAQELDGHDRAYALNRQAVERLSDGQIDAALETARAAVAAAAGDLGPGHPGYAAALLNLGNILKELGRYDEAEQAMREALHVAETSWGIGPLDLGKILNTLGALYAAQARYPEAEALYLQALAQEERIGRPDVAVATWLNNLATAYARKGRADEAWPLYERSMTILADRGADEAIAETFSAMAALKAEAGEVADAERLLTWSLGIRTDLHGRDNPATALAIHNLGVLYRSTGRLDEAAGLLEDAYRIRRGLFPADHPEIGSSQSQLALLNWAKGDIGQARKFFRQASRNLQVRLADYFLFMSEDDRLAFLDTVEQVFAAYYSFCLAHADDDPGLASEMYNLALIRKGMVARSVREERTRLRATTTPAALALFDRLAEQRRLIAERSSTADQPLEPLRRAAAETERALAREIGAGWSAREAPDWRQVSNELPPTAAAVEYVLFDAYEAGQPAGRQVYAAIVLGAGEAPRIVPLGDRESLHGAPLTEYRQSVGLEPDASLPHEPGFAAAFWRPVQAALGEVSRVYVSPAGVLNIVAWAGVQTEGEPLTRQVDLRLLGSTGDLVDAASRARGSPQPSAAVLIGDPAFGTAGADASPPFAALPGTRAEVREIGDLLAGAGWQVASLQGVEASETAVFEVSRPRILHLATHGFFRPHAAGGPPDPMLRSGLALAGAGAPDGSDRDGILTALEASTLDLSGTELVVLSACETGLGSLDVQEGVFGLQRAFYQAGARALLMSLWNVPDQETRQLMVAFYRAWLGGADKHAALVTAQMQLREATRRRWGFDRPQLWAGFVLIGP